VRPASEDRDVVRDPQRSDLDRTPPVVALDELRLGRTGWSLVVVLEILGLAAFLAALALLPPSPSAPTSSPPR
jgi:hypothetical protein